MKISFGIVSILSVITLVIGVGHVVVYQAVVAFFSVKSQTIFSVLRIVTVLLSLSFVVTSIVTMLYSNKVLGFLYTASAVWLGTFFWLLIASTLGALVLVISRSVGVESMWPLIVGQLCIYSAFIMSAYGVWHTNTIHITRYTVALSHLPTEWQGKKIAMVADLHLGNVYDQAFSEKVSRLISEENPEAVLVPGDFYDGPPADFESLAKPFGALKTKYGTFFSTGNHESYREMSIYTNALTSAGVKVIDDKVVNLDGLQIIGLSYPSTTDVETQKQVLASIGVDPTKPSIVLKHVPKDMGELVQAGIGLQVSGHTHRGQVWPASLIAESIFGEYTYGHHLFQNMDVITTSGAGTWGPPQRIGTDSEIVIITLVNKE